MIYSQGFRPHPYNVVISCELASEMQLVFDWLLDRHPAMKPVLFNGNRMTRLIREPCIISMTFPRKFGKSYYRVVLSFVASEDALLCKLCCGTSYIPTKKLGDTP